MRIFLAGALAISLLIVGVGYAMADDDWLDDRAAAIIEATAKPQCTNHCLKDAACFEACMDARYSEIAHELDRLSWIERSAGLDNLAERFVPELMSPAAKQRAAEEKQRTAKAAAKAAAEAAEWEREKAARRARDAAARACLKAWEKKSRARFDACLKSATQDEYSRCSKAAHDAKWAEHKRCEAL